MITRRSVSVNTISPREAGSRGLSRARRGVEPHARDAGPHAHYDTLRLVTCPGPGSGDDVGSLLQTVTVKVEPGRLDNYVAEINKLQAVSGRVGSASKIRVWQATAAGPATGNVIVSSIHESLVSYANDTAKMQADPEWQKIIAGLDDMRTIVSSGLARSLSP